eukprot:GDKH01004343.1.p1 GENE.GDKH01004343.1~~GDKH01004343.1.p1  ORF type:complete len:195 (+),score=23.12 GDKH01004343.1:104-688(+)
MIDDPVARASEGVQSVIQEVKNSEANPDRSFVELFSATFGRLTRKRPRYFVSKPPPDPEPPYECLQFGSIVDIYETVVPDDGATESKVLTAEVLENACSLVAQDSSFSGMENHSVRTAAEIDNDVAKLQEASRQFAEREIQEQNLKMEKEKKRELKKLKKERMQAATSSKPPAQLPPSAGQPLQTPEPQNLGPT